MKLGHTIDETRAKCPELTDEILDALRVWSEERNMPGIPDVQLAIFAHSCYYDVEATKRCMIVYYRLRSTAPELFSNRDPRADYIQQTLKVLAYTILPVPDNNGNTIITHRLIDPRPSAYVMNDAVKLMIMSMEANLYNKGCTPGYIFLLDMSGVRLAHLTRISLECVRRLFEFLQEGLPVRLKAIHVLNSPWFTDKLLAILRPFMNTTILEMLHFYSGDVSQIYDIIPPKCLPKDYGGELESIECLHEKNCEELNRLRDYFLEEEVLIRDWSRKDSNEGKSSIGSTDNNIKEKKENGTIA